MSGNVSIQSKYISNNLHKGLHIILMKLIDICYTFEYHVCAITFNRKLNIGTRVHSLLRNICSEIMKKCHIAQRVI